MTATLVSSPWPLPSGAPRGTSWRFAREVALPGVGGASAEAGVGGGFAIAAVPRALQWLLRRNVVIAPRRLALLYLALCAVSLVAAGFFFLQGSTLVMALTGLELAAMGVALAVFARHAGDRETLTLVGRMLKVEQCFGSRVHRTDFAADWVTVEPAAGQGSLVQLSGRGQLVRVGRLLRPELRGAFAGELRQALRRADAAERAPRYATDTDSN